MAEKIKKFFARKKVEAKFKLAGAGHKLNEDSTTIVGPSKKSKGYVPQHHEPTAASQAAALAAMARVNQKSGHSTAFNTSLAAIQAQVRRELEAEKKKQEKSRAGEVADRVEADILEASPLLAVKGVYFKCPLVSEEILSKDEWKVKIKEFLLEQLEEEKGITACLMIHSCNYNRTKVNDCVEILCKYLDNIISHPDEVKYQKIRCSNAAFRDKVAPIFGAIELLEGAGFTRQILEQTPGNEEEFYVFNIENIAGIETLEFLKDALKSDQRVELELERNLQVLSPAQAAKRMELPRDFYAITAEELKREQEAKKQTAEKELVLRTKAMREKEELREIRKYKFALLRIRFPDGLYLQGTFSVYEKFSEVMEFVQENLENENATFTLTAPTGHVIEDMDSPLQDLRLVPATILTFQSNEEASAASNSYLKPEIMLLVQSI